MLSLFILHFFRCFFVFNCTLVGTVPVQPNTYQYQSIGTVHHPSHFPRHPCVHLWPSFRPKLSPSLWCRIGLGPGTAAPPSEAVLISGLSFLAATWAHVRSDRLAAAFARWFLGDSLAGGEEESEGTPLLWVCHAGSEGTPLL